MKPRDPSPKKSSSRFLNHSRSAHDNRTANPNTSSIGISQRGRDTATATTIATRPMTDNSRNPPPPHDPLLTTMQTTTQLVLQDLVVQSHFFDTNESRPLAYFQPSELSLGAFLGNGEFGEVYAVQKFHVAEQCQCLQCVARRTSTTSSSPKNHYHRPLSSPNLQDHNHFMEESPSVPFPSSIFILTASDDTNAQSQPPEGSPVPPTEEVPSDLDDDNSVQENNIILRGRMAAHVLRHGIARYAVKRIVQNYKSSSSSMTPSQKEQQQQQHDMDAAIDLACEAKFLASLSHPNIVRLRGTVGTPGSLTFMMILDRLTQTLDQKINDWKQQQSQNNRNNFFRLVRKKQKEHALFMERLVALLDMARALRYLHRHRILYRDLKAENIGIDFRGDYRLFDFGLAKEVKPKDKLGEDKYNATGLTGSRRYMAPEVMRCLPYGLSADVYSFGILFWQLFTLKLPWDGFSSDKLYQYVLVKNRRPGDIPSKLSFVLQDLLEACWNKHPSKRPSMERVCTILYANATEAVNSDQTAQMVQQSLHSLLGD